MRDGASLLNSDISDLTSHKQQPVASSQNPVGICRFENLFTRQIVKVVYHRGQKSEIRDQL